MTVAETSERLGGGVLVTTNRPHHLVQNDALVGNSGEIFAHVKEVVTPKQIVIDTQEGRLRAGQPAQRAWGDTIEAIVRCVAALKSGLGDASKNYRCEGFHLT